MRHEDAENFSCQDLETIDKLWVKYSNGKYGFSVQKQIYQGVGGSKEYNWDDYKKFADKVGWRKGGLWLNYSELIFSEKHYKGHPPHLRLLGGESVLGGLLIPALPYGASPVGGGAHFSIV